MGLASIRGLMEENMKDNTSLIKNMEKEDTNGLMGECLMESGHMESSMEQVNMYYLTDKPEMVNGQMERELDGLMNSNLDSQIKNPSSKSRLWQID